MTDTLLLLLTDSPTEGPGSQGFSASKVRKKKSKTAEVTPQSLNHQLEIAIN